jgi:hypothetical protein
MARSGYPGSQSPQANRGTSQDFDKFGKREVSLGMEGRTPLIQPAGTAKAPRGSTRVSSGRVRRT